MKNFILYVLCGLFLMQTTAHAKNENCFTNSNVSESKKSDDQESSTSKSTKIGGAEAIVLTLFAFLFFVFISMPMVAGGAGSVCFGNMFHNHTAVLSDSADDKENENVDNNDASVQSTHTNGVIS
jgi:hypothetical protein